jgi:hypothetical protein
VVELIIVLPFCLHSMRKALLFNERHSGNQCGKWYFNVFKSTSENIDFSTLFIGFQRL